MLRGGPYTRGMFELLFVFVLLAVVIFGIFGIALLVRTSRLQGKAEGTADEILDAAFDGRPDVTFTINMTTLKYETVIVGAKQRGYQLTHQATNEYGPHTLIFENTKEPRVD